MKSIIILIFLLVLIVFISKKSKKKEKFETVHKIPRTIMQTNKKKPKKCIKDTITNRSPDWNYIFYDDDDIYNYFKTNPIDEFPEMETRFKSMPTGAHKADLFRYYFLYVEGGVFFDSDAMLECDLSTVIPADAEFISVNSSAVPESIFQGFVGCTPKNKIMYECLKHAYTVNLMDVREDYHLLCREMYRIIQKYPNEKVYLFEEEPNNDERYRIYDKKGNKTVLYHYFVKKNVPCAIDEWNIATLF
jgi:hypothetical protein